MSTTNIEVTEVPTEAFGTVENAESTDDNVIETVLELGFAWAAYGLKIATTAVEQAARLLGVTAKTLDKLADDFAAKSGVASKEVATK